MRVEGPPRVAAPHDRGAAASAQPERGSSSLASGAPARRLRPRWPSAGPGRWSGLGQSTQARMVTAFLVLLVASAWVVAVTIDHLMHRHLDQHIEAALRQEIEEVRRLLTNDLDPEVATLERRFELALARGFPDQDEAFLAFVDGRLHAATIDRYPTDRIPDEVLEAWAAFSTSAGPDGEVLDGTYEDELGQAHYRAMHVGTGAQKGAFVVSILPVTELAQIDELVRVSRFVIFGVVALAAGLAWWVVGRILAPVNELTEVARTISSPDRTDRIQVRGSGEAEQMARTFNDMLERLEVAHQSQLEFLRAAGHELRAPLTVVAGHLETLSDDDEDRRATIPLVLDEVHRMGTIVRDLELLARATRRDFLAPRPVELGPFTRQVYAKATMLGDRDWRLDEVSDEVIVGDPDRLTEAVLNLAENAVAHTEPGQAIRLGSQVGDDTGRLWVEDDGVGIDPTELDRIFERFARGRDAPRRYRGAGLGLALVSSIAEAHRGRVEVVSRPGAGARFTLVLPRWGTW